MFGAPLPAGEGVVGYENDYRGKLKVHDLTQNKEMRRFGAGPASRLFAARAMPNDQPAAPTCPASQPSIARLRVRPQ